jgi:hypothetical protein
MNLVVFGRHFSFSVLRARAIYAANNRSTQAYLAARNCPYFFLLVDNQDNILAECAVYPRNPWWTKRVREYHITDIHTQSELYLRTLLVRVMDMLAANQCPFVMYAERSETLAIPCYRALFGPPTETTRNLLTFRTPRRDSPRRRRWWCC